MANKYYTRIQSFVQKKEVEKDKICLLVSILPTEKGKKLTEMINDITPGLHFSGIAYGTAQPSYRSYLGIDEVEKRIVYTLIPSGAVKTILKEMNQKLQLFIPGNGIAFTLPLSCISSILEHNLLNSEFQQTERENESMNELIIAVVNQNYTDQALSAAREAGAAGATVLHTSSIGNRQIETKMGAVFSEETDTIAILTTKEFRPAILTSIQKCAGLKTDGGAVLFSLPVTSVAGIGRFSDEEEKEK